MRFPIFTAMFSKKESCGGAIVIEAAIGLGVFLVSVLMSFDVLWCAYTQVAMQYAVSNHARQISIGAEFPDGKPAALLDELKSLNVSVKNEDIVYYRHGEPMLLGNMLLVERGELISVRVSKKTTLSGFISANTTATAFARMETEGRE